jgi:hypothetical protein
MCIGFWRGKPDGKTPLVRYLNGSLKIFPTLHCTILPLVMQSKEEVSWTA